MVIVGTFCLIYYLILRVITKKWNSTFAVFWLLAGSICLILRMAAVAHPEYFQKAGFGILILPAAFFLFVEVLILCGMHPVETEGLPYLIVLGAQVQGTKLSDSLVRRMDTAVRYLKRNPDTRVIVSGGKGTGEDVAEALAMKGFLVVQGIAESRIYMEDASRTTKENLINSSALIGDLHTPVGIVTNNFHMYRAARIGKRVGYHRLYRIPADCSGILFVNYAVREFFAVCKMWICR